MDLDHETMVGVKKVKAGEDLVPTKVRKMGHAAAREKNEEWGGIETAGG